MSFLSNAHTHTTYCDGRSTITQTLEAARRLGFVSLGFSGHAWQGFDYDYCMSESGQEQYFAELHALQAKRGDIRVWAGLELDSMGGRALRDQAYRQADYIIGSTHYLCEDYKGQALAVDGDPESLRAYMEDVFHGDGLALASAYFDLHVSAILRDKPDIIGHFDLVRINAQRAGLFDESSAAYRRVALDALSRLSGCGAALELNTGAMARGRMSTPYPTLELLGAWREMGGRVTVTSDCHDCRYLDHAFDRAAQMLKDAGYTSVLRLGARDALWEECGIA